MGGVLVAQAELHEDLLDLRLDVLGREPKPLGDRAVREPLGDQPEDRALAAIPLTQGPTSQRGT